MAGTFTADISRFCRNANTNMVLVIQKIGMEIFKRMILRSPVYTGRFRANWGCTIGSPWMGFDKNARDKDGKKSLNKMTAIVTGWNAQGSVILVNNASYGLVLEYGRDNGEPGSKQAPQGMVRVTIAEMQAWCANPGNLKASIGDLRGATGGY